jgi:hypothetical protein
MQSSKGKKIIQYQPELFKLKAIIPDTQDANYLKWMKNTCMHVPVSYEKNNFEF